MPGFGVMANTRKIVFPILVANNLTDGCGYSPGGGSKAPQSVYSRLAHR